MYYDWSGGTSGHRNPKGSAALLFLDLMAWRRRASRPFPAPRRACAAPALVLQLLAAGLALERLEQCETSDPSPPRPCAGEEAEVITTGRHDPCVGIRATPIAEAMLALVLIDHALRHRGQNADVAHTVLPVPGSSAQE